METEKRLILCFALSMLIIFAFSWINAKNTPPRIPKTDAPASTVVTATPGISLTAAPMEISEATLPVEATGTLPVSSALPISWEWLPSGEPSEASRAIIVESPLYRVVFSTHGAIPVSWKLLSFKELLEDRRYLELQAKRGASHMQQLAQLELDLLLAHENNGPHYVEAIDSLFPQGNAGFMIRWGKDRHDSSIPYQCDAERIQVTEPTPVRFIYESSGLSIEKTYRFMPDSYHLEMEVRIVNQSSRELPFENGFYDFLWQGGFGFPSMRKDTENNFLIQQEGSTAITLAKTVAQEIAGDPASQLPEYKSSQTRMLYGKNVGWVGVGQKYFMSAIVPKTPTRQALEGIASPGSHARGNLKPNVGVRMEVDSLGPGNSRTDKFILYVGPINEDDLARPGEGLQDARQIFLRSIIGPIANLMLRLLQGMYKIVPNYGLAIIVLTLLMKVLMFPLYQKQIQTTKKMQALQPQINALKEKYKNDQQKLQKEQMELFRKHKVNPLSGCLTILTTIPVFIALYATFAMAVELRGAPFIGWIQDLSAPDGAFFVPIGSYIIPINILPLAYAILMLWSTSQQSMEGPNATAMKIVPLIFVFFFWSIASGVILYFVVSIFIDVLQRIIMDKLKGDGLAPAKAAKAR